jgi:hypothetical protein
MSAICKLYGIVDIATALILFFYHIPLPDIIKIPIILILLFKGIPSLFG